MLSVPQVRITLLGAGGAGKTAIANAFVNNMSPATAPATAFPRLYHRILRIAPENDPDGKKISVCVELEDTCAATDSNVMPFLTLRQSRGTVSVAEARKKPLGASKVPLSPYGPSEQLRPITHRRMGFMIVFDSNDPTSFSNALAIYQLLQNSMNIEKGRVKAIVFLVANKIDERRGSNYTQVMAQAESFAQRQFLQLWKVSALQFVGIRKMYQNMVYIILGNESLWQLEIEEESSEEEEEGTCVTT